MATEQALHDIKLISQHTHLTDPHWQYRGCGIASLKMIMDYWHGMDPQNQAPTGNELLETGLKLGAYIENIGWSHRGLVNIAAQYGYTGYNVDEPTTPKEELWQEVLTDLAKQPVMMSVYSKLDPARGGGHIIVLAGVHGSEAYIHDPEDLPTNITVKAISVEKLLAAWKRRYIVITPKI